MNGVIHTTLTSDPIPILTGGPAPTRAVSLEDRDVILCVNNLSRFPQPVELERRG